MALFCPPRVCNSIIARLTLLGMALVIVGAIVRYFVLSDFLRSNLETVIAEQQLAIANHVARDVDHKIAERQQLLEILAANLPAQLLTQPVALQSWLAERHTYAPAFNLGLMVLDRSGYSLAASPSARRPALNYADRDYFQAALAGTSHIGRPALGRASSEALLPMAAPVRDPQGQVLAVLVGATALAAPGFLDALMQGRLGQTGGFLLVSPHDRLFVAASDPAMVLKPTPAEGVNPLHDRAMSGYRGTGLTVNAAGVEELSAIAPVPSTDWFVVARLPTEEAFATLGLVQRFVIRNAVMAICILALVFVGVLYWLLRPLLRAADQADRMTLGQIPLEPLKVVRSDEVGHLIAAFNRLLDKLREKQDDLARLAHHDPLTGLPNRLLLSDRLQQALARAKRQHSRLALFFLDLDGFKPINDTLGHEGGDEALRQVAERLLAITRKEDTLARVGGDEFVLLVCDLDEQAADPAAILASKCIEAFSAPFLIAGQSCQLGVSIGIALGDGDSNAHDCLLAADRAMFRAKQAGRGCFVFEGDTAPPAQSS